MQIVCSVHSIEQNSVDFYYKMGNKIGIYFHFSWSASIAIISEKIKYFLRLILWATTALSNMICILFDRNTADGKRLSHSAEPQLIARFKEMHG